MLMAVAPRLRKICEILQLLWILGSVLALNRNQSGLVVSFRDDEEGRNIPDTEWAYVQKWMKKTIDDLKGSWLKVASSMNKVAKAEETKIEEMRNSIKNDVKKEVSKLQREGNTAKVDIRECLKEVADGGDSFADSLLRRAIKCITDEASRIQKLVSREEQLANEVNLAWQDARRVWNVCESSPNVDSCRSRLVADAAFKEGNFTSKEHKLKTQAAILANKLQSYTDYCVTTELSNIPALQAGRFTAMEDCVKQLIDKKNEALDQMSAEPSDENKLPSS